MSVFYEHFERHGHGDGLKGQSTHYCPGCGHGLAHKYLAEAIKELGIQDRTVAVSKAGLATPRIDNVRRRGGVLPQQAEIVERVRAGTAVRNHEGVAV